MSFMSCHINVMSSKVSSPFSSPFLTFQFQRREASLKDRPAGRAEESLKCAVSVVFYQLCWLSCGCCSFHSSSHSTELRHRQGRDQSHYCGLSEREEAVRLVVDIQYHITHLRVARLAITTLSPLYIFKWCWWISDVICFSVPDCQSQFEVRGWF